MDHPRKNVMNQILLNVATPWLVLYAWTNVPLESGKGGLHGNRQYCFHPCRFFQELNSQLFRTMLDVSSSEDHVLTIEMVDSLGLDPVRDRQFLTELATLHRLNMNVQRPAEMFDIFSCCGV